MNTKKAMSSLLLALIITGCTSSPFLDETGSVSGKTKGTAGGAAAGALIGQLIGKDTKEKDNLKYVTVTNKDEQGNVVSKEEKDYPKVGKYEINFTYKKE